MEWEGPEGREVVGERAAGVWLVHPLLNPQDLVLDLAHRVDEQKARIEALAISWMFEVG